MASKGHVAMHLPQPTHLSWSMTAFLSIVMADTAQNLTHFPQDLQTSGSTLGFPAACISSLPLRDPQPMARFFSAPP